MPDETQSVQTPTTSNGAPSASTASPSSTSLQTEPPQKSRKRWTALIIVVVLAVLAGVTYTFAVYLPNTPDGVYNASLRNMGLAFDRLTDYASLQRKADYKSADIQGTIVVKSPDGSYDIDVSGASDKDANADVTLDADAMGEHITGTLRSVHASASKTPDIYVRITGAKKMLSVYGLGSLDSRWVKIDHTIIDTFASRMRDAKDTGSALVPPTPEQILDALKKAQTVNKRYLFTTNKSNAVLTRERFVGVEQQAGRNVNHYKVGYDKAHLRTYLDALKTALDTSKLNDWSKQTSGKNISETMDIQRLQERVARADAEYTFDLWADPHTKLVSKLEFVDAHDQSHFIVSQDYTGGNTYPLTLRTVAKDDQGNPEDATLGMTLDAQKHTLRVTLKDTLKKDGGTTMSNADFIVTPSNKTLHVVAPKDAMSVNDLLRTLLGGDLAAPPRGGKPVITPAITL